MNIAWIDIRYHLVRFLLTAAGVGLLFTATIGMIGLYRGVVYEALMIINNIGADIWIVEGGRAGPFAEESEISWSLERRLQGIPGIAWSRKFIQVNQQYQIGDRRLRMAITGLDFPEDNGSWVQLSAGRHLYSGHYGAIADQSLGFQLGERIRIRRDDYTIVGITVGQVDMGGDGILFVTVPDARTMENELPSEAVLLRRLSRDPVDVRYDRSRVAAVIGGLGPGADLEQVKSLIQSWGDVNVYSRDEEADILINGRLSRLRNQILAFVGMTLMVTIIVVGLSIYAMTVDKVHQIALLKLMGAKESFIFWMILQQALLIGLGAFAGALMLSHLFFPHFPRTVLILWDDVLGEFILALALCAIASLFGIRKAVRVRAQDVLS